jgi:hypothetical protein
VIKINPVPKVALLVSGHARTIDIVNSLNQHRIQNIDVFVFAWDQWGSRATVTDLTINTDREEIENCIQNIYGIKKYIIANNNDFIKNNDNLEIKYFNWMRYPEVFCKSNLYAISKAYELMEEYVKETGEGYDLVIKVRFENPILQFNLNPSLIEEINQNKIIYFPDGSYHGHPLPSYCTKCQSMYEMGFRKVHIFEHDNPVCDMYAYGSMSSMKKYCSLFYKYDQLCKKFEKHNLSMLEYLKTPHTKRGEGFILELNDRIHWESIFFYFCSYPERMLSFLLKDYMLLRAQDITFGWNDGGSKVLHRRVQ